MTKTVLRATTESGQRWEAGEGSFLIVERVEDASGHIFAQARLSG